MAGLAGLAGLAVLAGLAGLTGLAGLDASMPFWLTAYLIVPDQVTQA